MDKKRLNKGQAAILAYFLGPLGIHRLVLGYKNWWLQTITLGGLFIWSLSDLFSILVGRMKYADGTPLKK